MTVRNRICSKSNRQSEYRQVDFFLVYKNRYTNNGYFVSGTRRIYTSHVLSIYI